MRLSFLIISIILGIYTNSTFAADNGDFQLNNTKLERPSPDTIPYKEKSPITGSYLLKVFIGFVVAISIGFIVLLIFRHYYYGSGISSIKKRNIYIEEIRRITPKTTLILVKVKNRRYTISQCGDNINILNVENDVEAINDVQQ